MNKTEARYERHLDVLRAAGQVRHWWFEGITLKLAHDCRLTPDFLVMLADGSLECHDVKGHFEDDAKVKMRVAASLFPFRFVAVRATRGGWEEEDFSGKGA